MVRVFVAKERCSSYLCTRSSCQTGTLSAAALSCLFSFLSVSAASLFMLSMSLLLSGQVVPFPNCSRAHHLFLLCIRGDVSLHVLHLLLSGYPVFSRCVSAVKLVCMSFISSCLATPTMVPCSSVRTAAAQTCRELSMTCNCTCTSCHSSVLPTLHPSKLFQTSSRQALSSILPVAIQYL